MNKRAQNWLSLFFSACRFAEIGINSFVFLMSQLGAAVASMPSLLRWTRSQNRLFPLELLLSRTFIPATGSVTNVSSGVLHLPRNVISQPGTPIMRHILPSAVLSQANKQLSFYLPCLNTSPTVRRFPRRQRSYTLVHLHSMWLTNRFPDIEIGRPYQKK